MRRNNLSQPRPQAPAARYCQTTLGLARLGRSTTLSLCTRSLSLPMICRYPRASSGMIGSIAVAGQRSEIGAAGGKAEISPVRSSNNLARPEGRHAMPLPAQARISGNRLWSTIERSARNQRGAARWARRLGPARLGRKIASRVHGAGMHGRGIKSRRDPTISCSRCARESTCCRASRFDREW
jgi:hypothetical protein